MSPPHITTQGSSWNFTSGKLFLRWLATALDVNSGKQARSPVLDHSASQILICVVLPEKSRTRTAPDNAFKTWPKLDSKSRATFHNSKSCLAHHSRIFRTYSWMIVALVGREAFLVRGDTTYFGASRDAPAHSPRTSLTWAASKNADSASSRVAACVKCALLLIYGAPCCCQALADSRAK